MVSPSTPPLLLPLYFASGASVANVVRAEFNYETGRRVHERLSSYMGAPMTALHIVERYRSKGGFPPSDLGAAGRDAFLRWNSALTETYPQFSSVYYGLEDGTFAGHGFHANVAMYREPGHSGYSITVAGDGDGGSDDEATEDPAMDKHYWSCVDDSGEGAPCRMEAGGKYTECVAPVADAEGDDGAPRLFDCALEKCPDEDSRRDCEGSSGNETEQAGCRAGIKWCQSYIIKVAPTNETLGYIPRSNYCIDRTGVPSQTQGGVVKWDQKELGSCYYMDGVTLVERSRKGDFAYCGGNGEVCNGTFVGAWRSRDYDPRWREWYIDTKALQKPNWSPPHPYMGGSSFIGITYSVPLYTIQDDGGRNVFMGVLAADCTLDSITNFLRDSFGGSSTIVTIFEQAEPHYMIASSTSGAITKHVLVDDESKTCVPSSGACKAVRIPAAEFAENDVTNAFSKQKEEGFPETRLVSTDTNEDNILFATQSKSYSVDDAELDWTIMIMTPVETDDGDTIVPGSTLFGALVVIATLGFAVCSALVGLLLQNRMKREVIVSDWRFMSGFVGGCALLNASCLSFLGENTDGLCLTRMWLPHFFFVFTLSFLIVKTHRMYKLVGAGFRRITMTHAQTARMALPFIGLQAIILLIFTFVDPSKREEIITTEGSNITHRYICVHNSSAFFIVMLLYEGGLVMVGCVMSFKTRNLRDEFNESKQIILAIYDAAVIGSITLIVTRTVGSYQAAERMLVAIAILWTTCFASVVFVIPRLLGVRNRIAENRHGPQVRVTGEGNTNGRQIQTDGRNLAESPANAKMSTEEPATAKESKGGSAGAKGADEETTIFQKGNCRIRRKSELV